MEHLPDTKAGDVSLQDLDINYGQLFIIETRPSKSEQWPSTAPDFAREASDILGVLTRFRSNSMTKCTNANNSNSTSENAPDDVWR